MSQPPPTSRTHYSPAQSQRGRKSRWERRQDYVRRKNRRYREEAHQMRFWDTATEEPAWAVEARSRLVEAGWTVALVSCQRPDQSNAGVRVVTLRCRPPGDGRWRYPDSIEEIETWLTPSASQ